MFQFDQCDKTTKTSHGLRSHKLKFHEAPRIENKTLLECGYCNYQSKRKDHINRHEETCKEKLRQMQGPVEPLTKEELMSWFSDTNMTQSDFNSIMGKIGKRFGPHFLKDGVKVSINIFLFQNDFCNTYQYLQKSLKSYCDEMGKYSAVGNISFKTSDGSWQPRTVGYIATVRQLLMDWIHVKGYKRPGVVVSMDSGAGKFLVTAKVYDRDNLSGMIVSILLCYIYY